MKSIFKNLMIVLALCFQTVVVARRSRMRTKPSALHLNTPCLKTDIATHVATQEAPSRTIKITNDITKKMITYHKFGAHIPKPFTITANGHEIEQNETKEIPLEGNKLNITYAFKFGRYYEGADTVEFEVEPSTTESSLNFKWKDDWRLSLAGAKPVAIVKGKVTKDRTSKITKHDKERVNNRSIKAQTEKQKNNKLS